ncbi:MAG: N-acetylmuramoyl-L-alanine amidase [Halanaerobiales bacterium]|nr:N-acetylmuramoyl-L-alanine amidase [Halanaerobiales bacterium]
MFITIKVNKKICGLILLLIVTGLICLSLKTVSIPSNTGDMEFTVVVDPGHGSIDTGTSHGNIYEKDINLQIGRYLNQELKKVNIIPIMTRTKDKLYMDSRRKDIRHRPEVAKEKKADLFISIHANNFPSSQPSGSQIFYKPGSELSKILAEKIRTEMIKLRKENNRCIKSGDFYVLNQAPCPAVLIEVGFLSNPVDRQKLINPKYQQALAVSIKRGIVNYFQSRFGKDDIPDIPTTRTLVVQNEKNYVYYLTVSNKQDISLINNNLSRPANNLLTEKYGSLQYNEILAISALEQLLNPSEGLISPLPEGTKIKSVRIEEKKAVVDFSSEIRDNFRGGAGLEVYAIQSISKTLFSIPGIEELEILIDGKRGESIGGHIILNQILKKK